MAYEAAPVVAEDELVQSGEWVLWGSKSSVANIFAEALSEFSEQTDSDDAAL